MYAQRREQPFFVSWHGWQLHCVPGDIRKLKTKKSVICFVMLCRRLSLFVPFLIFSLVDA